MGRVETEEEHGDQIIKDITCPTKKLRLYPEVHREPQKIKIKGVTCFAFLKNHSSFRRKTTE